MASVIAAQLYTVRDFCKTPADIASTMKKVREIGYEAVQCSGMGEIGPKELRKIVDGEGITICATHTGFDLMRDETDKVIEDHKIIGCEYAAIGGSPAEYRQDGEGYKRFAKEASEVAKRMAAQGIKFGYHNHSHELERFGDRTGLAILYEDSDPKYFLGEIDTYWVQHGGGDVCWWMRKLAGRLPLLHLKDMKMKGREQRYAEVGEGNLNWEGILAAAKEVGVEWYIVEQDNCYERDPFDSLKISFDNMKAMGLK